MNDLNKQPTELLLHLIKVISVDNDTTITSEKYYLTQELIKILNNRL